MIKFLKSLFTSKPVILQFADDDAVSLRLKRRMAEMQASIEMRANCDKWVAERRAARLAMGGR